DIYYAFTWSKHNDLIKEYSDMCKRIFSLSGVISFNQGIVSLGRPWIFPKLFSLLNGNFKLSGEASYEEYENDIKSSFYQDICISDILELSYTQVLEIQNQIAEEFGIADISNIKQFVADKQEREFREFVEQEFGITKVSEVLSFISQRNDKKVQELVTDNALVPTIFEYILAIAWYYISDKKFQLRKSMQLTFSADNLPLSHAGGNKGDIEIEYSDKMLLLEATLMDKSTQKRGELEPVIRHSVNLALSTNKPLQTIFVANEVDDNVVNIFRATSFIQLNGTLTKGSVKGLNIFALTIPEIINILDRKINEQRIFEKLDDFSTIEPYRIENGWREEIVSEILA
ncbi:TPA: AlwI family type II restriction endonuclease, partial [Streptococcus pneumoniae]|nr:AlwI family type II restriction endonuclease [Streptococcus pneumoniae]